MQRATKGHAPGSSKGAPEYQPKTTRNVAQEIVMAGPGCSGQSRAALRLLTPTDVAIFRMGRGEFLLQPRLRLHDRSDGRHRCVEMRRRHMAATERTPMPGPEERTTADVAELLRRVRSGRRQGHYYVALFGLRRYDSLHVMDQARRGLTFAVFERLARNTGSSQQILADLAGDVSTQACPQKRSRASRAR